MPASRVDVTDESGQVLVDYAAGQGQLEVVLVNRGPNDIYINDSELEDTDDTFQVKVDEGFRKTMGRKEKIYVICAEAETATVHIFADDID